MASVTLSWAAAPASDNVTAYQIWGANGTSTAFGSCTLLATVSGLTWTDIGLPNSQARTYYIVAVNAVGSSSPEGPINITTAAAGSGTTFATAAEVQAGTVNNKPIAPDALQTAAAPQTLTAGATIPWDMSQGFNAKVTLGSAANAFQTPTNPKEGITYRLEMIQDATGGRTATYPTAFDFGGASTPVLSTAASKHDFIYLDCYDASTPKFRAVFNKGS
jgi:hypothetical protein